MTNTVNAIEAAAVLALGYAALRTGHEAGDYWVQTDHQAGCKGQPGWAGRKACLMHVAGYTLTQAVVLTVALQVTGLRLGGLWAMPVALLVSAVTHYLADRREYGLMIWLARLVKGQDSPFLKLGIPREPWGLEVLTPCSSCHGVGSGGDAWDESTGGRCWDCRGGGTLPVTLSRPDNPSLGTGTWALDQSWHHVLGCFVPAVILALSL